MSLDQFDKGYWYIDQLRTFAKEIGIQSTSKLRKDELEEFIRHYLLTHQIKKPPRKHLSRSGMKDIEKGLRLDLPIVHYTDNKETKDFIKQEARKLIPDLKQRSGVLYRLNRWREAQINQGIEITYGDLVGQYIKLNQFKGSFAKIPHGRYINFLADYFAFEQDATREKAIQAWEELKGMNIPKDYDSWKKNHPNKK